LQVKVHHGINNTGTTGVVLLIPLANLLPVLLILVANNGNNTRLLTPQSEVEEKNVSTYMATLLPMVSEQNNENFLMKEILHLLPVSTTLVVHLELRIFP
jgi:hypothetical protein